MTKRNKKARGEMTRTLKKETVMRAGYVIRVEEWSLGNGDPATLMRSAYTPRGEYIGTPKNARYLVKRGIRPELRAPDHSVCSIGYCERERKWYGWSHRAIYGFGIGSRIKKGDCTADGPLPVGFTAKTLADAKRMAEVFAESVS